MAHIIFIVVFWFVNVFQVVLFPIVGLWLGAVLGLIHETQDKEETAQWVAAPQCIRSILEMCMSRVSSLKRNALLIHHKTMYDGVLEKVWPNSWTKSLFEFEFARIVALSYCTFFWLFHVNNSWFSPPSRLWQIWWQIWEASCTLLAIQRPNCLLYSNLHPHNSKTNFWRTDVWKQICSRGSVFVCCILLCLQTGLVQHIKTWSLTMLS